MGRRMTTKIGVKIIKACKYNYKVIYGKFKKLKKLTYLSFHILF